LASRRLQHLPEQLELQVKFELVKRCETELEACFPFQVANSSVVHFASVKTHIGATNSVAFVVRQSNVANVAAPYPGKSNMSK
jgi:hypothetical protein